MFAKINNRTTCVKGHVGKRKSIFSIKPSLGSFGELLRCENLGISRKYFQECPL